MIDNIKIMPEVMANPIWDKDGVMMSWSTLDCPDDHLVNQLVIWNYQCDQNDSCMKLEVRGYVLATYVKHYFPGATVVYQYDSHPVEISKGEAMWKPVGEIK